MLRAPTLVALTLALVCASAAVNARTYAVLSLIGDRMLVVNHGSATGSSLNRDTRQFVPLDNPILDRAAVLAVDQALRRIDRSAKPILLAASDPALFAPESHALDGSPLPANLVDPVRAMLKQTDATHVILILKHRHEADLKIAGGSVGSGKLEGVGFYVDRTLRTSRGDTGERGVGFLAPFAYFRVVLVDLAGQEAPKEEPVTASLLRSGARSETLNPWDALSSQQKVETLQRMIRSSIGPAVARLVTP